MPDNLPVQLRHGGDAVSWSSRHYYPPPLLLKAITSAIYPLPPSLATSLTSTAPLSMVYRFKTFLPCQRQHVWDRSSKCIDFFEEMVFFIVQMPPFLTPNHLANDIGTSCLSTVHLPTFKVGLWLCGHDVRFLRSRTEVRSPVWEIIMYLSLDQFGLHW